MSRLLPIVVVLGLVAVLVPACQGDVSQTSTSTSTEGTGAGPVGCEPPCCIDNAQFPIQQGNTCVQCVKDSDCQFTPPAYANGDACLPNGMCGCAVDNDCGYDGVDLRCHVETASCVQCSVNADCDTTCDVTTGTCAPCTADTDCAPGSRGPHCTATGCGCTTSDECSTSLSGQTCLPSPLGGSSCGCAGAAECAGSAPGHVCITPLALGPDTCGCTSDADCDASSICQTTAKRCVAK